MANEFKIKKGLIVQGSGSTILDIQGSQGQLFSVTDLLSGSLFSVNDISGIPIVEVFSDNSVNLGTFGNEAIKVLGNNASITGSLFGTASFAQTASVTPSGSSIVGGTGSNGQVAFWDGTNSQTGDNGLFWDNTNKRLEIFNSSVGVGIAPLIVRNNVPYQSPFTQFIQIWQNPGGGVLASVRADGRIFSSNDVNSNYFVGNITGTISSPVFRLGSNGLFFPNSSNLGFVTNAVERMRITSTGNVGIGTTSPSEKLHVVGNTILGADNIPSSNSTYINKLSTPTLFGGLSGNRLSIATSTATIDEGPALLLDNRNLTLGSYDNGRVYTGIRIIHENNITQSDLVEIISGDAVRMVISGSTGNVGIGTTSPSERLDVVGGNISLTSAAPYFSLKTTQTGTPDWKIYNSYNSIGDFAIVGGTSVDNKFNIQPNGNVGIGTTTPSYKLSVVGKISLNDGGNSVFIGEGAGANDDASANQNVGVGFQALQSNTTGANNIAIGTSALQSNTTGNFNTAIGTSALQFNTTGNINTANGVNALRNNTTGVNNTANGVSTLQSNTTGNFNTAIGTSALQSNTTGNINTANGVNALQNNTTGANNTANGVSALQLNIIGANNTAIGTSALQSNTTGFSNTANGAEAGRYIANGSTSNTNGTTSVFLGTNTKALANSQVNQIVIGHNATGLGSNTVVLGNDSIVTTALRGNVGIGTTAPNAKLDIVHNSAGNYTEALRISNSSITSNTATGIRFQVGTNSNVFSEIRGILTNSPTAGGTALTFATTATSSAPASERVRIDGIGNVGIGTTTPGAKLDVSADSLINGLTIGRGTGNTSTNTAVGFQALQDSTSGVDNNTALGYQALKANTTGDDNTAIGNQALVNTTTKGNTAVGSLALQGNTGGSDNTAIGFNAGRFIANGSTSNTSGDTSVFLGAGTKASADSQVNQIVIGHNATGLGSNTVVLGNDSIVTTALKGSVGVGTTVIDASAILEVRSTTKGFLPPVMNTTDRDNIGSPANGLMIFNTDTEEVNVFTSTNGWRAIPFQ